MAVWGGLTNSDAEVLGADPLYAGETEIKTMPKKKKCKTAKWLSEEALQIAVKKEKWKGKEKRKDIPIGMQSSKE